MEKHILIVDDDSTIRNLVQHSLSANGYKVTEPENGDDALALLSEDKSFDMVVTDINMPVTSGIELIEEMGRRGMVLPVFLLSGSVDVKMMSRLLKQGFSDFLAKPFKAEELIQKINDILAN